MNENNSKKMNNENKNQQSSADLNQLGREIGRTLNNALETAFKEAKKARSHGQNASQKVNAEFNQNRQNNTKSQGQHQSRYNYSNRYAKNTYRRNPVGSVTSVLLIVFGLIGLIGFGIPALVLALTGVAPTVSTVFTGIAFLSLYAKFEGDRLRKRLKRYQLYVRTINNRTSCTIKDLSTHADETEKFVYRDLKKMIRAGMFPDANFNINKTVIMMTKDRYENYLQQQDELDTELKNKKAKEEKSYSKTKIEHQNDWPSIERAGKAYVKVINELKNSISDELVVENVYKTEILTIKILEYAQKKSKDPNDVRRLMNYYLPETINLLKTYAELDAQPIQGSNMKSAKDEISSAIISINDAFEQLFDSLFEDEALNVSADISVLNTVFSQNGLKEDAITTKH